MTYKDSIDMLRIFIRSSQLNSEAKKRANECIDNLEDLVNLYILKATTNKDYVPRHAKR